MKLFRLLLLCSVLILFACNDSESSQKTGSSQAASANIVELGVMPSMDYLPLAVAQEQGYFEKLGVKVHVQKFYSSHDRDAAWRSGKIDGTVTDFTGAILSIAGGEPVVLTSKCDAPFFIVSSKKSGITKLSEVKGKTVATSQNSVIDYLIDVAIASVGLQEADVVKTIVDKIPLRFEMVRTGDIDVVGLPNPLAMMSVADGAVVLTTNADLGLAITGIAFSKKAMEEKGAEIALMYEAYNMGAEYLAGHSAKDIAPLLVKEFGFPEGLAEKAPLPVYSKAVLPDNASIDKVVAWLKKRTLIPADFDATGVVDGRYVR